MRPDVQRDPDVLDRAAARLLEAAADLRAAASDPVPDAPGADARRIADELDSLAATAARAGATTRAADESAAARLRRGAETHDPAPGRAESCISIRP